MRLVELKAAAIRAILEGPNKTAIELWNEKPDREAIPPVSPMPKFPARSSNVPSSLEYCSFGSIRLLYVSVAIDSATSPRDSVTGVLTHALLDLH